MARLTRINPGLPGCPIIIIWEAAQRFPWLAPPATMAPRHSTPPPDSPPGSVTCDREHVFLDAARHDPYQPKGKYREPTICSTCRAIYQRGRWAWGEAPEQAHDAN